MIKSFPEKSKNLILNCFDYMKLISFLKRKRKVGFVKSTDFGNKMKNYPYYFSSCNQLMSGEYAIVGIDLTGSEDKGSGFAILSGQNVATSVIYTDDQILKAITKISPRIVSIDSPLSLPTGRCCADKECQCAQNGIMRYCELTLRHFGIGVYPCLIDSMVNLTQRGIRLAQKIRDEGIEVIESYPGVAQDLLHIPRKRSGLDHLVKGLESFGLRGIRPNIVHDEADAITSALVGCFYVNNLFVPIGNEKEGYLIVPKLGFDKLENRVVIGLTGNISAGKTTIAEYLRFKYGFNSLRYSDIIRSIYNVSGRADLQRVGLEISKDRKKQTQLSEKMIESIDDSTCYVIDGLRRPEDYERMNEKFKGSFILINIDTKQTIRFARYKKIDAIVNTLDDFVSIDKHNVEDKIDSLAQKASYHMTNNSSYKELLENVDTLMNKLAMEGI
jgi:predicted nuclease with RNAse H fold/dephospho-CoA kinase